jgi:EamA domain-containing membrane protein RarD
MTLFDKIATVVVWSLSFCLVCLAIISTSRDLAEARHQPKYIESLVDQLNACHEINQRLLTNGHDYYGTTKEK